ncbi:MAG: hypothetical protein WCK98_05230 [bacterium]
MSEKEENSIDSEKKLSNRQRNLLFAVIKEYCETGEGVGSKEIREKYGFNFSSATIRNEFSRLRDTGFLYQPFTNSSSHPTEKAFKLFINQLIAGLQVTNHQQQQLKKHILELEDKQTNLNKEITRLLAVQGGGVGFTVDKDRETVTGIGNLLESPGDGSVSDILDFLDNLDQYKKPLLESSKLLDNQMLSSDLGKTKTKEKKEIQKLKTIFGLENPIFPLGKGYAMVATEVFVDGHKSVVGIIAPTRLVARKKSLELIDNLSKVLGDEV